MFACVWSACVLYVCLCGVEVRVCLSVVWFVFFVCGVCLYMCVVCVYVGFVCVCVLGVCECGGFAC